jgi:2,5-diamino-6-(ribosylamino)-4(3H)-pyrimidinone 5'-phosphate reductase
MQNRPETTLFMLTSVDGKISTGDTDALDFDRDLPSIAGVREGLYQYYELEQQTDLYSLNTGRVMAKIGMNDKTDEPKPIPCSFVIIDNKPHLTTAGVTYLSKKLKKLILVTTNPEHPAVNTKEENVVVLQQSGEIDFGKLFERLKQEFGVDALTIQSGGTLNATFFREGLIDHLSIVVAPLVVGGSATSSLVDGESNHTIDDLKNLVGLKLIEANTLEDSFLHLRYDVMK